MCQINRLRRFKPESQSNVGLGGCEPPQPLKALENIEFSRAFYFRRMGDLASWQTIGKHFDSNRRRRMRRPDHELRAMWRAAVTVPRGRADPDDQRSWTVEKRRNPSFQTPSAARGGSAQRPLGTVTSGMTVGRGVETSPGPAAIAQTAARCAIRTERCNAALAWENRGVR